VILFSSLALLFVVPICHLLLLSFNRPDASSISSSNNLFKYPLYGGLALGSAVALQQNALNNEPSSINPSPSASNCSTSISTSTTEYPIKTTSSNPQHSESTTEDSLSTSITTEMNQLSTASASTIQFNQTTITTQEPTNSHPAITNGAFDDDKTDQNLVTVNILTTLLETLKTNSTNGSSSSIGISNQTTQFSVCNDDTVLTFNSTVKPIAEYSIRPHNSTELYIIQIFSSMMKNNSVADEDITRRYNP